MEGLDGGKAGGPAREGPPVLPGAELDASNTWLFPLVHDELRSIARTHWQRVGNKDVLEATALVHEVYLRLQGQNKIDAGSRSHSRTIKDDWMVARAFLHRELKAACGD